MIALRFSSFKGSSIPWAALINTQFFLGVFLVTTGLEEKQNGPLAYSLLEHINLKWIDVEGKIYPVVQNHRVDGSPSTFKYSQKILCLYFIMLPLE